MKRHDTSPRPQVCDLGTRGYHRGMRYVKRSLTAVAGVTAAVVLSACGTSEPADPMAGLTPAAPLETPISTTTNAPMTATPTTTDSEYADLDALVAVTAADAADFWKATKGVTVTPKVLPSNAVDPDMCGKNGEARAWACPATGALVYDQRAMEELRHTKGGTHGVMVVVAHEVGHLEFPSLGLGTGGGVEEQRADCSAGAYMGWLVDGHSDRIEPITETEALGGGLSAFPTDGSGPMTADDAQIALRKFKQGFDNRAVCVG